MHKTTGAAVGVLAALLLSGCVEQPHHVVPTSVPAVKPVFKSNADALAAAKKVFEGYIEASDSIGRNGGKNPKAIEAWVTTKWFKYESKLFSSFASAGKHLSGNSRFSKFTLQQLDQTGDRRVSLTAYVCDDVSATRVLDDAGKDVTPIQRPSVVALQVDFVNSARGSSTLLIDRSDSWSGADFC